MRQRTLRDHGSPTFQAQQQSTPKDASPIEDPMSLLLWRIIFYLGDHGVFESGAPRQPRHVTWMARWPTLRGTMGLLQRRAWGGDRSLVHHGLRGGSSRLQREGVHLRAAQTLSRVRSWAAIVAGSRRVRALMKQIGLFGSADETGGFSAILLSQREASRLEGGTEGGSEGQSPRHARVNTRAVGSVG